MRDLHVYIYTFFGIIIGSSFPNSLLRTGQKITSRGTYLDTLGNI